ncbi:MAG: isoprenylcysteine carboxylmethyltransferase family protein [Candidatus Thorarchaeota archaeon]
MADEFLFAVLFVLSSIGFWTVRGYYIRKTRDPNARRTRAERKEAMKKEGWTGMAIVLLFPVEIVVVIVYLINPLWLSLTSLMIPELYRWLGLFLAIVSIPYAAWVHQTLGRAYSYALETKSEQTLVTTGPFSRVRHPLYSAHNIFNLGMVVLTLNIPLIIFAIVGVPITYVRMQDEERMMMDQFGEEYKAYMMRTGRIFPKFFRRPAT